MTVRIVETLYVVYRCQPEAQAHVFGIYHSEQEAWDRAKTIDEADREEFPYESGVVEVQTGVPIDETLPFGKWRGWPDD